MIRKERIKIEERKVFIENKKTNEHLNKFLSILKISPSTISVYQNKRTFDLGPELPMRPIQNISLAGLRLLLSIQTLKSE